MRWKMKKLPEEGGCPGSTLRVPWRHPRRPFLQEKPKEFNDTPDYLWKYFINRVRDRLHFVLCFSPVGDKFRTRARKFPGLVAYCTINWFFPWPVEALLDVATKFLEPYEMETDDKTKQLLYAFVANIHNIVNEASTDYFQRFRKAVYCTPKSYLGFIDLYRDIYKEKVRCLGHIATPPPPPKSAAEFGRPRRFVPPICWLSAFRQFVRRFVGISSPIWGGGGDIGIPLHSKTHRHIVW